MPFGAEFARFREAECKHVTCNMSESIVRFHINNSLSRFECLNNNFFNLHVWMRKIMSRIL